MPTAVFKPSSPLDAFGLSTSKAPIEKKQRIKRAVVAEARPANLGVLASLKKALRFFGDSREAWATAGQLPRIGE